MDFRPHWKQALNSLVEFQLLYSKITLVPFLAAVLSKLQVIKNQRMTEANDLRYLCIKYFRVLSFRGLITSFHNIKS